MKTFNHFVFLIFLSLSIFSCTTYRTVGGSGATIPAGTEVSFEKITNPAYANDYINAEVITDVEFFSATPPKGYIVKIPKGHIAFQVIPIGGSGTPALLGNAVLGTNVFIPKDQGDMIFDLKRGDKLQLRGGAQVRKNMLASAVEVNFIATSISKL